MKNLILKANTGLKTKFDPSNIKFKKTFKSAERGGIDLNNTTEYFKRDGTVWKISFISSHYSKRCGGKYFESIEIFPMLTLYKK